MTDNKDMFYKREVITLTVQESYTPTNPSKFKSEKSIEEDKMFHTTSYLKEKTSKLNLTNAGTTYITRNKDKVEYSCDECDIVCSGIDNFNLHIKGKKHKNKLKERKILEVMGLHRKIEISTTINCDVCETNFSKLEAYLQHCKDETHQKILKTKKMINSPQFPEYSICTKSSFTYCDFCKIWFSPMTYDLHMKTSEHCSKVQKLKELVVERFVKISSKEGNCLTCETCDKNFNGHVPYMQHLMSKSHSKKDDIAKEMVTMNILRDHELYCKDCEMELSGIVQFNDHMRGSSHKRQLKKKKTC